MSVTVVIQQFRNLVSGTVRLDSPAFWKQAVFMLVFPATVGLLIITKTKLNSVALVRERTIPTERPPQVGEVSANFCG